MSSNPFVRWPKDLLRSFLNNYLTLCDVWVLRFVDLYFANIKADFMLAYYKSNSSMIRHCYSFKESDLKDFVWAQIPAAIRSFNDQTGSYLSRLGIADRGAMTAKRFLKLLMPDTNFESIFFDCLLKMIERSPVEELELMFAQKPADSYGWPPLMTEAIVLALQARYPAKLPMAISMVLAECGRAQGTGSVNPLKLQPEAVDRLAEELEEQEGFTEAVFEHAIARSNKPFIETFGNIVAWNGVPYSAGVNRTNIAFHKHSIEEFEQMHDHDFMDKLNKWLPEWDYRTAGKLIKKLTKLSTGDKFCYLIHQMDKMWFSAGVIDQIVESGWAHKINIVKDYLNCCAANNQVSESFSHGAARQIARHLLFDSCILLIKIGKYEFQHIVELFKLIKPAKRSTAAIFHLWPNLRSMRRIAEECGTGEPEFYHEVKRVTDILYDDLLASCCHRTEKYFDIRRAHRATLDYCDQQLALLQN